MKKLIVKTAVKTALIILGIFIAVSVIMNFGFPGHMATMFENIGNYRFAAGYAATCYDRSGKTDDLVRCVDDSILAGNETYILKYGKKLIADESFAEVCEKKDAATAGMNYRQLIYGKIAVVTYGKGDLEGAITIADEGREWEGPDSFGSGNAVYVLCLKVVEKKDSAAADRLTELLGGLQPTEADEQSLLELTKQELQDL